MSQEAFRSIMGSIGAGLDADSPRDELASAKGGLANGVDIVHVTKSFGPTRALEDISLSVPGGTVLALFGENGAGKSTLLGALAGAVSPDSGEIYVGGSRYRPRSPRDALSSGVALVAQELLPCLQLSVAENIVVGKWPNGRPYGTSRRAIVSRARELVERFGVDLPLDKAMAEVSVGEMQLVEVLRVLNRNTRVVLMDEPTAALNGRESQLVLDLVRRLAVEGVTVVLVTHRIQEALSVANEVAVLRGGHLVYQSDDSDVEPEKIVEEMLGRRLAPREGKVKSILSVEPAISFEGWSRGGMEPLENVSFSVRQGEVVGMYGVRGSGLSTLARALAGVARLDGGITLVGSRRLQGSFRSPRERETLGVHFVPGDRARAGLALMHTTGTNLVFPLGHTQRRLFRNKIEERRIVRRLIDSYGVVGIPDKPVAALSGGNQQKVLMASRLGGSYRVLVVEEPTRGVDVGAREVIHNILREIGERGVAVVVISSDVDEIVELVDRALVFSHGRLTAELKADEMTVDQLLLKADARLSFDAG